MKRLLAIIMVGLFFGCSDNSTEVIHLVKNGKPRYTITLPQNPSPEEMRAAQFFNHHIERMAGCELPIIHKAHQTGVNTIIISKSDAIATGDGFSIKTLGNTILLTGGNKKGCVYAVSELLEQYFGVRYFSPVYVVIPTCRTITLPRINIENASPNTFRNVNGAFAKDENYRDFHRLHITSDMFAEGYYVHTFHRLVPWQEYFDGNPEYFALMNGKRIIDQLCLTNQGVFDLVVEKLEKEMKQQPDKLVWSVSQDDNFSYCQCDDCKSIIEEEKSPAGPIVRFVNRVAEHFPDKIISTLAYQYSRQAPLVTKPQQNVQIMLCTIELNRSMPIATDERSASFLKDMEDWGKISNHIYLWDYTVDFAHSISPFPNLHTLQPNIQLFVENNVAEHFQQTNTGTGHEFSELKSYLLSKLLWNPDADVAAVIQEFTGGYYGAAAPWIRNYLTLMEAEILKTGEWLDIYGPPTNHQNTFLSAENIAAYNRYFDEAERVVANSPEHLLHVRTARMPLQYAIMEIGKADMFGERGWYTGNGRDFVPRKEMLEMLEAFYLTGISIDAAPVNESGLTVEAYYYATKRFVDVQVKGNLAFRQKVTATPPPAEKYSDGNLAYLTNGVRGANDFKVHWLGWEAKNFSLTLDLSQSMAASTIEISTLYDPKSWILHPKSITCLVSEDGKTFTKIETQIVLGDQHKEEVNRLFTFKAPETPFRYVKFDVEGTQRLFDWHPSAGGGSWVFVDEIVVR